MSSRSQTDSARIARSSREARVRTEIIDALSSRPVVGSYRSEESSLEPSFEVDDPGVAALQRSRRLDDFVGTPSPFQRKSQSITASQAAMEQRLADFDRMFEGPSRPRITTGRPNIDHARSPISREDSSIASEEHDEENPISDNAPRPQTNLEAPESQSRSSSAIDSTPSEDSTDWEEDNIVKDHAQRLQGEDDQVPASRHSQPPFLQPTLDLTKKEILDSFIQRFRIFRQTQASGVREVASGPASEPGNSAGASTSRPSTSSTFRPGTSSRRRRISGADGREGSDENHDEVPANGNGPSDEPEDPPLKFACPYRKRDPRKYCLSKWRRCALTPHESVSRVKAHLYKYHIIHQCQRCKTVFESEKQLDLHIETAEQCDPIIAQQVDGITRKMESLLRSKKPAFKRQTQSEKWKQVYQILFPEDVAVPDPYFEPVLENEEIRPLPQELADLTDYEDFLRRRLPGVIRSALVTPTDNEVQPIEERLINRLTDIVDQAHNRLFHEYQGMVGTINNGEAPMDRGHVSNRSTLTSSQASKGKRPEIDVTAENSHVPHDPSHGLMAYGAALYQPARTDLNTNFESPPPIQQGFDNMHPPGLHAQIQETTPNEEALSQEFYADNQTLLFSQPWGTTSAVTDFDDFMFERLLRGDSADETSIS